MGGMAAQIPIKDDKAANDKAMDGVRADKLREVTAGHDGYVTTLPTASRLLSPGTVSILAGWRRARKTARPFTRN